MSQRPGEILVIDDEAGFAELIGNILREEGFAAVTFSKSEEALAWIDSHRCELVVSDYQMPGLAGADFITKVRENHPNMPFVIVSGNMNTRELIGVANLGVASVLEKPLDREALVAYAARFCARTKKVAHHTAPHPAPHAAPAAPVANPYPAGNLRSAQTSAAARTFLQSLWDALRSHNGATLSLPIGGELELVVSDVEKWFSLQPPAIRLSPLMMNLDAAALGDARALVIVDGRYSAEDLGKAVGKLRADLGGTLPVLVLCRADAARPCDGLPLVALPPLSVRVGDIAAYARTIFERVGSADSLTPDAARLLLNYPWPGNYYELMGALRRAMLAAPAEKVDAAVLSSAISSGHGAAAPDAAFTTLETYLESRQAQWFAERHIPDIAGAAKAAQLPESAFNPVFPVGGQRLLFPDVLRPEA
jgi:CheY-like chemotaxis protein